QRRSWDPAVEGPSRELDARRDLDLLVERDYLPLAQHAPARQAARLAVVEVAQDLRGVKAVGGMVDLTVRPEGRAGVARAVGVVRDPAAVMRAALRLGARVVTAAEGVVETLVRNRLVQQRQRGPSCQAARQQAPATHLERLALRGI